MDLNKRTYERQPHLLVQGIAFEKQSSATLKASLLFEEQSYSYQALNEWANQIAHYYLSLGAKR